MATRPFPVVDRARIWFPHPIRSRIGGAPETLIMVSQEETDAAAAEEPVADAAPSDPVAEEDPVAAADAAAAADAKPSKGKKAKGPSKAKAKAKKPATQRKPSAHPPYAEVRIRWR